MPAHGKTMAVGLKTMAQARLHNTFTAFYLQGEAMNIGVHLLINVEQMSCHNRAQQNATKTRCGVGKSAKIIHVTILRKRRGSRLCPGSRRQCLTVGTRMAS